MEIFKSASKIVFLLLAVTTCIAFAYGLLSEENFMVLTAGAFTFYFSNKGTSDSDYLGK